MNRVFTCLLVLFLLPACGPRDLEPDAAIECERCADWNEPLDPFRIHGNTWYVGTDGLSAILIETGDGLVLIDGGLPQSAALIEASIRELGFDAHDIVAILLSHPHYDHAGGINALQRMTGASVYTSEAGIVTLGSGRLQEGDPQHVADSDDGRFPAARNVLAAGDGERLVFGEVGITAVHTPGHTAGSVTWTWQSCALGTCYDVVYADSLTPVSAPGFSFAESGAATSLIESAGVIADLECDILLSPHPFFFGLYDKLERIDEGNPFVNELACTFYAEEALGWLEQRLEAEGYSRYLE
ncbi:MAG: subclass B3 metallo-beta-lactamase [Gammaproteobacteria bacterium]|nr:subclass B3 metallo-beta-lactamase [Gammaproteobacteria bacterium]MBT8105977.1 subclass B3 metallo-beta-lactamase [Gammaproteobacteria bacterium]NNF49223.1 subclass B3 metallo-beta-lactamase [Woeseiaceae bacterium]NNK25990.1 subclass B3 metallo-beta-lactamase [Woeseiaceae bacterium]NNL62400.1 subclass B3 metallo-beta-lactamase [Woeseiaceae bacterium]